MIEPMQLEDIPAVMEVERQSFTMPWPSQAYRRELKENSLARYIVARRTGPPIEGANLRGQAAAAAPPPHPNVWRALIDRLAAAVGAGHAGAPSPDVQARRVVGYAGIWLMVDEAHITAIAVATAYRGLGVGELLLLGLIDLARSIGARYITLEVRVSNSVAQNLYRKYGFKETGVRRRYYSDNSEDALIMWSDPLESPGFIHLVEEHRRALLDRLRSPGLQAELRARGAEA